MIDYREPSTPPDDDDMDPLIAGMHPAEWPTVDDLMATTAADEAAVLHEFLAFERQLFGVEES